MRRMRLSDFCAASVEYGLLLSLWLYWELSAHKRVVGARSIALRARLCTTAVDLFVWTTLAAETLGLQSL